MTSGKILQCFVNTNMRLGYPGLYAMVKRYKIDLNKLEPGEFIVCINSKRTMMKVLAAHKVISEIRVDSGQVSLNTVRYFPAVFQSKGKIDYDEALRLSVERSLQSKGRTDNLQVFTSAAAAF